MLFPTITFAIFFLVVYAAQLAAHAAAAPLEVVHHRRQLRVLRLVGLAPRPPARRRHAREPGAGRAGAPGARAARRHGRRPPLAHPRGGRQPRLARRVQVLRLLRREPQRRARRVRPRRAAPAAAHHPAGRHLVPRLPHAELRDRHLPRPARRRRRRWTSPCTSPSSRTCSPAPSPAPASSCRSSPRRGTRTPWTPSRAFVLILGGLAKKMLIADYLSTHIVNGLFAVAAVVLVVGDRSGASSPTRCRSTATSAPTPTSPSASRCCSGSSCRTTSTRRTRRAPSRTSGAAGTSPSRAGCATTCTSRSAATARAGPHLRQPRGHLPARRPLARGGLDVRLLGGHARHGPGAGTGPRRRASLAGSARARATAGARALQRARRVRLRQRRLGVLPRRVDGQRLRGAVAPGRRAGQHRLGGDAAGGRPRGARHRHPVRAAHAPSSASRPASAASAGWARGSCWRWPCS